MDTGVTDFTGEEPQEQAEKEHIEKEEADERSSPSSTIVYRAILKEGEEELARPSSALFWSGLAAGMAMGFSMIAEGLLSTYLPHADWTPLVSKFGYSAGFLVVILGRQQLFTENTLTPILPLLQRKPSATIANVLRLWSVVLAANLLGALAIAFLAGNTSAFDENVRGSFAELGRKAMEPEFGTVLLRGVFAGWMIALIVWLLPFAEAARVWVIVLITYLVGLGEFSHSIAGSVETFTAAAMGEASWVDVIGRFILPTLIGNIIGGVTLVAALNHGQVVAGHAAQTL